MALCAMERLEKGRDLCGFLRKVLFPLPMGLGWFFCDCYLKYRKLYVVLKIQN